MADKPKNSIFYGWVIAAAASIILAIEWGCDDTYVIFLPELCESLGWSRTAVSGAYSLGFIIATALGVVAGKLNDRYGPRLIFMFSTINMSLGFALMSIIKAPWQLYIFYGVIANIGMGFAWVPAASTVSHWFIKKRGRALGLTLAGAGVGALIMIPFAQFLILRFGWRISYLILASLPVAIALPASRLMRLNPSEKGLYPDGVGEITESKQHNNPVSRAVDFTLKQAIRARQFWLLFIMHASSEMSFGMLVHLKAYAVSLGIAEMTIATAIGAGSAAYSLGAVVIGRASDKIGRKASLFICYLSKAVMMLWLIKIRQAWQFYLFSIIFYFAAYDSPFSAIIADYFGVKFYGGILGLMEIAVGIGAATGPVLAGYIFDATGSYELAIIIGAVALFIAMGLSLIIKEPETNKLT